MVYKIMIILISSYYTVFKGVICKEQGCKCNDHRKDTFYILQICY